MRSYRDVLVFPLEVLDANAAGHPLRHDALADLSTVFDLFSLALRFDLDVRAQIIGPIIILAFYHMVGMRPS